MIDIIYYLQDCIVTAEHDDTILMLIQNSMEIFFSKLIINALLTRRKCDFGKAKVSFENDDHRPNIFESRC